MGLSSIASARGFGRKMSALGALLVVCGCAGAPPPSPRAATDPLAGRVRREGGAVGERTELTVLVNSPALLRLRVRRISECQVQWIKVVYEMRSGEPRPRESVLELPGERMPCGTRPSEGLQVALGVNGQVIALGKTDAAGEVRAPLGDLLVGRHFGDLTHASDQTVWVEGEAVADIDVHVALRYADEVRQCTSALEAMALGPAADADTLEQMWRDMDATVAGHPRVKALLAQQTARVVSARIENERQLQALSQAAERFRHLSRAEQSRVPQSVRTVMERPREARQRGQVEPAVRWAIEEAEAVAKKSDYCSRALAFGADLVLGAVLPKGLGIFLAALDRGGDIDIGEGIARWLCASNS